MSSSSDSNTRVGRLFKQWLLVLNDTGTVWIFALMLLINTDILLRWLFKAPIDGVPEMIELSIACIVFLQLGDAVRAGRLTRSDGLYNKIKESRPRLGYAMAIFFDLAGAAFFLAILFGAVPMLIEAWEDDHYAGNEGIFTAPIWPIRLIMCISCITVVLVFLTFVWRHIVALRTPEIEQS